MGHWKDYDELEDSLSIPELLEILKAYEKQKFEDKKFAAALKGVELDDPYDEGKAKLEDIKRRAKERVSMQEKPALENDVINFTHEIGIGHETVGG